MKRILSMTVLLLSVSFFAFLAQAQQPGGSANPFRLHDGDTVVFYGDSITEQKLYTSDIENYVLTRFPGLHIRFVHSGVGGDKVSGGWAGPIDLRLSRDVFFHHPTMITIMLGMNDGYYRPLADGIEETFQDGYRHLVARLQAEAPKAALTLLKPSPYDDVTRPPDPDPGYNSTMVRFGNIVGRIADESHALVADLNRPVVDALIAAKAADPSLSSTLIRDRVHPGTGIHWLMAESVLKSWDAVGLVTAVNIDAIRARAIEAANTDVTQLQRTKNGLSWVQNDRALPLPFPPAATDPFIALVRRVSDLDLALDQQVLRVQALAEGTYQLQIDDHTVGTFTPEQLAAGVNLAGLDTPMLAQSRLVAVETDEKNEIESTRFQLAYDSRDAKTEETIKRLDSAIHSAIERQHADAQPVPHRYALVRSPVGTVK